MNYISFCFALFGLSLLSTAAAQGHLASGNSIDYSIVIDSSDDWVLLNFATISTEFATAPRPYGCVATASADVQNPGPAFRENQYRFVLTNGGPPDAVDGPEERTLELVDNPVIESSGVFIDIDDPDSESVTVTSFFEVAAGTPPRAIHFWGRKVQASDTNARVLDSSLSVICAPPPGKPFSRQ